MASKDDNKTNSEKRLDGAGRSIAELAAQCRGSFQDALKILPDVLRDIDSTFTASDLDDLFEQFRVWARNIGAFAHDEASLDYRLREASSVQRTILNLLQQIKDNLTECNHFATKTSQSQEESDNSDASSDSSYPSEDESRRKESRQQYEIRARLEDIGNFLDNLLKISAAIRKSAIRSRSLRGTNYQRWEDGVNLTARFEDDFLRKLIDMRCDLAQPLKDRLFRAIALRRRRFEYQQAHQERLAYGVDTSHNRDPGQKDTIRAFRVEAIFKATPVSAFARPIVAKSIAAPSLLPPSTKASDFDPKAMDNRSRSSYRQSPNSASANFSRLISIPDPPRIKKLDKYFECPYCCILISSRKLEKHAWRKHVIADLRPFICLSSDCTTAEQEFDTEDEWFEHHRRQHAIEWWCDGDRGSHRPQPFLTRDELESHVKSHHTTPFSETQLQSVLNAAASPSQEVFDACPFCDFQPPQVKSNASTDLSDGSNIKPITRIGSFPQATFKTHIANHLLEYFLIALPDRTDIQEQNSATRTGGGRSSMKGLDDHEIQLGDQIINAGESNVDPDIPDAPDLLWEPVYDKKAEYEGRYPGQSADNILKSFIAKLTQIKDIAPVGGQYFIDPIVDEPKDQIGILERKNSMAKDLDLGNEDQVHQRKETKPLLISQSSFEDEEHYQKFLAMLVEDPSIITRVREQIPNKLHGTCTWILGQPDFARWMTETESRHVIIYGKPACGKSVLAKYILDRLRAITKFQDRKIVLEYFTTNFPHHSTILNILRSLLYQLLVGRSHIFGQAILSRSNSLLQTEKLTLNELKQIFVTVLQSAAFESIFVILDVGNDVQNESYILEYLSDFIDETSMELTSEKSTRVNLLATSCKTNTLIRRTKRFAIIDLDHGLNMSDISQYVMHNLQHLNQTEPAPTAALSEICKMIETKCQGSFLWVVSCLRQLQNENVSSEEQCLEVLTTFPDELSDLYMMLLLQLVTHPKTSTLSESILGMLLLVEISLPVEICAIEIDRLQKHHISSVRNLSRPDFEHHLEDLGGSFISIEDGFVSIRHAITKDFLHESAETSTMFDFNPTKCHGRLAEICLQYLLRDERSDVYEYGNGSSWDYALQNWPQHLRLSLNECDDFSKTVRLFFESSKMAQFLTPWNHFKERFPNKLAVTDGLILHVLAFFDLLYVFSAILIDGTGKSNDNPSVKEISPGLDLKSSINIQDTTGTTALLLACTKGYSGMVRALLRQGADIDVSDDAGRAAIHIAIAQGNNKIVDDLLQFRPSLEKRTTNGETPLSLASEYLVIENLLKHGAVVDSIDADGLTRLCCAARDGESRLVDLLLDWKADVNHRDHAQKTPLYYAVVSEDEDLVRLLLRKGASANYACEKGWTPLHLAAAFDSRDLIEVLLAHGADINQRSVTGCTALYVASFKRDAETEKIEAVNALLEAGADASIQTEDGDTPLFGAAAAGHNTVANKLISAKADVNHVSKAGFTPLTEACNSGQFDTVQLLIVHGADINFTHEGQMPMLQQAIMDGHLEVAKYLILRGVKLDSTYRGAWTPLYVAAWKDQAEIAKLLLEKGAVPTENCTDGSGQRLLHRFAEFGRLELMEDMLSRGMDPSPVTENNWTPLHYCAYAGHLPGAKCLLRYNPNIFIASSNGYDSLLLACQNGHTDVAAFLLECGADLSTTNNSGFGVVSVAAENGHLDTVEMLLRLGADLTVQSRSGVTALQLACTRGHFAVVELLLKSGDDPNVASKSGWTPLLNALMRNHEKIAWLLYESGANINVQTEDGFSPIHEAARHGLIDLVERFIDAGCDPNLASKGEWTPVLLAVSGDRLEMVKFFIDRIGIYEGPNETKRIVNTAAKHASKEMVTLLLEAGADPHGLDLPNDLRASSIFYAASNGKSDVVELLLSHGVDPSVPVSTGDSPLHEAASKGHTEVVRILLREKVALDVQNHHAATPIGKAAQSRRNEVVTLLIEAGADPTIRDRDGMDALDWAHTWPPTFAKMGHWKTNYTPPTADTRRSRVSATIQEAAAYLRSLAPDDLLPRLDTLEHLSESLLLADEPDLAKTAVHLTTRTVPFRPLSCTYTCDVCLKSIETATRSILICRTCIVTIQCSTCFADYEQKDPLRARGCSGHEYLEIKEADWGSMEPTEAVGLEKEARVLERLVRELEEKFGGGEGDDEELELEQDRNSEWAGGAPPGLGDGAGAVKAQGEPLSFLSRTRWDLE